MQGMLEVRQWLIASSLVFATLSGSAFASDELEVYGKINVTLQDSDEATGEQVELQSNASRVGVKGKKTLSAALKVNYQLEWGVNIDTEGNNDNLTPRNQVIGLEGSFGSIEVGRHDTALKQAQGDFDVFNDLEGDITRTFNGENRLTNYIGYVTPAFGKAFTVTLNFFPGEDPANGDDGVADKTSVSLVYQADSIYAAIAHDNGVDGKGSATTRVVGGYTFGPARLMLLYQLTDNGAQTEDGYGASIAWTHGKYVAKIQYLRADIWKTQPQSDPLDNLLESQLSVGLDRKLGDATRVFGFYTTGDIGGTRESNNYVAIGIEHDF